MNRDRFFVAIPTVLLAACSSGPPENSAENMVEATEYDDGEVRNQFGFSEAMTESSISNLYGLTGRPAKSLAEDAALRLEAEASVPAAATPKASIAQKQIAYTYDFGFAIEQEKIPELQKAHVAICESMGDRCRVLRLSQAGTDGFDGYGELRLQIAADEARTFGDSLSKPAKELGGEQVSFVVEGEDLSETIIDTKAKVESRLVLRDKLTAILRNNRGSVEELVAAERAVAEVNEELDASRSKLENLSNRLTFSRVAIEYNPYLGETSTGFVRPVVVAFKSIGSTLGWTISVLIYIATALVPITLFLLGLRWLWRKSGIRIRRPKTAKD